jgi:membrane protease YdiL (CAAX protease family)
MPNLESEINRRQHISIRKYLWLWIELIALYGIVPPIVAGLVRPEHGDAALRNLGITGLSFDTGLPSGTFIFPILLFTFVSMFIFLRRDASFDNHKLWNWNSFRKTFRRIIIGFGISAPIIFLVAWVLANRTDILDQRHFLYVPREYPFLMLAITFFYPWISAYPQEITHRAFFFHRYELILGSGKTIFIFNVMAFSWLHAPMWNMVALIMTIPAGVIFAWTYRRSDSALASGFEHAIYGIWVFFTGLGYFVFAGR